ncbi:hypothetical protein DDB_G0267550 [Dictyostelium discoideum AX4]|uniref:Uncharacterized protein n=1 Tax=Dictyostelium discoideum TaxID=44689 RepID=Q55GR2_DICDI|nr:hypothetical protein DDB_G0267550 [Dictyostelium discoideum AX4]EAL73228.1 hypothetical protein DDB_G0267550 [Dictyostelium discoideum AX4]|eukprot:XP_647122.1 hypothetical protein DDB_G0267550 [Dictyostelium discoideum AX4]
MFKILILLNLFFIILINSCKIDSDCGNSPFTQCKIKSSIVDGIGNVDYFHYKNNLEIDKENQRVLFTIKYDDEEIEQRIVSIPITGVRDPKKDVISLATLYPMGNNKIKGLINYIPKSKSMVIATVKTGVTLHSNGLEKDTFYLPKLLTINNTYSSFGFSGEKFVFNEEETIQYSCVYGGGVYKSDFGDPKSFESKERLFFGNDLNGGCAAIKLGEKQSIKNNKNNKSNKSNQLIYILYVKYKLQETYHKSIHIGNLSNIQAGGETLVKNLPILYSDEVNGIGHFEYSEIDEQLFYSNGKGIFNVDLSVKKRNRIPVPKLIYKSNSVFSFKYFKNFIYLSTNDKIIRISTLNNYKSNYKTLITFNSDKKQSKAISTIIGHCVCAPGFTNNGTTDKCNYCDKSTHIISDNKNTKRCIPLKLDSNPIVCFHSQECSFGKTCVFNKFSKYGQCLNKQTSKQIHKQINEIK